MAWAKKHALDCIFEIQTIVRFLENTLEKTNQRVFFRNTNQKLWLGRSAPPPQ
jgi:hypothetical protein